MMEVCNILHNSETKAAPSGQMGNGTSTVNSGSVPAILGRLATLELFYNDYDDDEEINPVCQQFAPCSLTSQFTRFPLFCFPRTETSHFTTWHRRISLTHTRPLATLRQ